MEDLFALSVLRELYLEKISNMKAYAIVLFLSVVATMASAQSLISGPMAGHTTMRSTTIWAQFDEACLIALQCHDESGELVAESKAEAATVETAYSVKIELFNLEPGKTYRYRLLVDGALVESDREFTFQTQPLWQFRTDPPTIKLVLGSCAYINEPAYDRPGKPYGGGYEIFESMANASPDLTLWLGDYIYLKEVDWTSYQGYLHRYTHARSIPEMQALLQIGAHYAIWDDHDFGPNDANGAWIHKDWALNAFQTFWANPTFGTPEIQGITTAFQYGDIDFFLLDNRYHRTSDDLQVGEKAILGKAQIEWLVQALKYSRAPFKMVAVGGQVLNDAAMYENHAVYGEERTYLLQRIEEENIRGVVFLTGDRHHTELSKMTFEDGREIYDLTVSPLTSGVHANSEEVNNFQVDNTMVAERNYAVITFSGARKDRSMKIAIFDSKGALLWDRVLHK